MNTFEEVKSAALALARDERELLWIDLRLSVEDDKDPDYDEAWAAEIERRIAEMDAGLGQPIPGDEVLSRLRERVDASRLRVPAGR